jgi:hypothetical protein
MKIKKVNAGERIYDDRGDRVDTMHIILAGTTAIYQ